MPALSARADHHALIDAVIAIQPLDLPLYPRSLDEAAALADCAAVHEAAVAYISRRMEAVERHTGVRMEIGPRIGDLTGIFADSIRTQFYAAESQVEAAAGPARRRA